MNAPLRISPLAALVVLLAAGAAQADVPPIRTRPITPRLIQLPASASASASAAPVASAPPATSASAAPPASAPSAAPTVATTTLPAGAHSAEVASGREVSKSCSCSSAGERPGAAHPAWALLLGAVALGWRRRWRLLSEVLRA